MRGVEPGKQTTKASAPRTSPALANTREFWLPPRVAALTLGNVGALLATIGAAMSTHTALGAKPVGIGLLSAGGVALLGGVTVYVMSPEAVNKPRANLALGPRGVEFRGTF